MPTHIEEELGLGPLLHRIRRWFGNLFARMGMSLSPRDRRALDPLTVNYAAWRETKRHVRAWPHYKEAPNSLELLVSPEDWDDYWGIDVERKEHEVATYVRAQAAKKGFWMSGDPQVYVAVDDDMEIGEVEVICQFLEPLEEEDPTPASQTAQLEIKPSLQHTSERHVSHRHAHTSEAATSQAPTSPDGGTMRFVDAAHAGKACLADETGSFRLVLSSGDCIGAVRAGDEVPSEVNVRLDADGFPYVEAKQCTIEVLEGRWTITNHAERGTKVLTTQGARLMLREPSPYPLSEGDVVYLGPNRPLRFELEK